MRTPFYFFFRQKKRSNLAQQGCKTLGQYSRMLNCWGEGYFTDFRFYSPIPVYYDARILGLFDRVPTSLVMVYSLLIRCFPNLQSQGKVQ